MKHLRVIVLVALVGVGALLIALLVVKEANTPLGRTFAPLFALMGKSIKSADRMFSRVLPLKDIDEKVLGDGFKEKLRDGSSEKKPEAQYLNRLVKEIAKSSGHSFEYEVFVESGPANAYALPGGAIVVYTGLLEILTSEAQVVAVLAHEVGHVERGHCFDSVRFALMADKLHGRMFGEIVDILYRMAVQSHFSKTQEQEADEYGFQKLIAMGYAGGEFGAAFQKMLDAEKAHGNARDEQGNILSDYFDSHPPLPLRVENYRERSKRWKAKNPSLKQYVGTRNFKERVTRYEKAYPEELQ